MKPSPGAAFGPSLSRKPNPPGEARGFGRTTRDAATASVLRRPHPALAAGRTLRFLPRVPAAQLRIRSTKQPGTIAFPQHLAAKTVSRSWLSPVLALLGYHEPYPNAAPGTPDPRAALCPCEAALTRGEARGLGAELRFAEVQQRSDTLAAGCQRAPRAYGGSCRYPNAPTSTNGTPRNATVTFLPQPRGSPRSTGG